MCWPGRREVSRSSPLPFEFPCREPMPEIQRQSRGRSILLRWLPTPPDSAERIEDVSTSSNGALAVEVAVFASGSTADGGG